MEKPTITMDKHRPDYIDRHRVCPYCKTPFFAENLKKVFCSKTCVDRSYNEKRYLAKQKSPKVSTNSETTASEKVAEVTPDQVSLNYAVLRNLGEIPSEGVVIAATDLEAKGFVFDDACIRKRLYRPKDGQKRYCQKIGQYRIFRVTDQNLLIIKK